MSVNKVILVGRLTAEPESRSFPSGGSICNLRLATNESWKDKQTGEKKERAEYHRVVLQNRLGEVAQQYLHKGSQVYIEGSIRTNKWQDQNGADRYSTEIRADSMTMLGGGETTGANPQTTGANSGGSPQPASPSAGPDYGEPQGGGYLDDDVPFIGLKNEYAY